MVLSCQEKKNRKLAKLDRKLEKLESVMLAESGKGRNKDGRTAKANRALKQYEAIQKQQSFIQFRTKC